MEGTVSRPVSARMAVSIAAGEGTQVGHACARLEAGETLCGLGEKDLPGTGELGNLDAEALKPNGGASVLVGIEGSLGAPAPGRLPPRDVEGPPFSSPSPPLLPSFDFAQGRLSP